MSGYDVKYGDALELLREMPEASVHCCITSPPYYGLRDYGVEGQLGLEGTLDEFVEKLVAIFREVRRVLRDDGTLWLNLGDGYAGSGPGSRDAERWPKQSRNNGGDRIRHAKTCTGSKRKDLLGVPWMVAFAFRSDGWWLRSEIIWSKPNPMPASVADRPTVAHETIFLLAKSQRYYYDAMAIREPDKETDHPRRVHAESSLEPSGGLLREHTGLRLAGGRNGAGASKRSVWTVATSPYPEAHFATYPAELIKPMVLAGCPRQACGVCGAPWEREVDVEYIKSRAHGAGSVVGRRYESGANNFDGKGMPRLDKCVLGWSPTCEHNDGSGVGVVLDPFVGSGTTLEVAVGAGRHAIGIDLNPRNERLIQQRMAGVTPSMFDVAV